ncbi:tRNA1(Val) (adenine(37)-N6)-methyltransferase [Rickettsiales bacterium LUAb2]
MFTTQDKILNGKVIINQPEAGYRVGIDAILLASVVEKISFANKILDLGAGVGAVSLSILSRINDALIYSIEKEQQYYQCALQNKQENSFAKQNYFPLLGDIKEHSNLFNSFDIVVSNPPYYKAASGNLSPIDLKLVANTETSATLKDFIDCAYNCLKPKGIFYIIHTADRLQDILNLATINKWGNITVYPIYSFNNRDANRVIISLKKLSKEKLIIKSDLVIHNNDNSYTNKANAIIKNGFSYNEAMKLENNI